MFRATLLLLSLLATSTTLAVDREALAARATDPETGAFPAGWALGPGVFYETGLYKSADSLLIPVPTVYYRGKHCMIYVKKGGCKFFESKFVELSGIADLRLDGFEPDDGDFLEGMDDRHISLDGGLGVEFDTPFGNIELEATHDLLGNHEGYEIALGWSAPIVLKRWVINFSLAHHWKSSDMADYYYGVKPSEALPGRPAYDVGSATMWGLVTTVNYRISPKWLALALASYEAYDSDIKDSPIVEDSGQFRALVGAAYRFGE